MGLSNELSCEAGSFFCCHNFPRCFQSEVLRLISLRLNPGLCGLSGSPVVPPGLSACKCGTTWSASHRLARLSPPGESSPPWLPVSAPPTGLDECFLYNSLVVRLPYSSILWQIWLFFVLKFILVLLLVVRGSKVYLPRTPSWPEVHFSYNFCFFAFLP